MKRSFILVSVLCLIMVLSASIVHASYSNMYSLVYTLLSKNFGGTITDTKAKDIRKAEDSGYTCNTSGSSIEITPQKKSFPSSYYIPPSVTSKTKNKLMIKQKIIGKYSTLSPTIITCTKPCPPNECTTEVTLENNITLYGNSKE